MKSESHHIDTLIGKATLSEEEVLQSIAGSEVEDARMELIKLVYGRHMPYCYSISSRLNVGKSWDEFEEKFHQFIHDKLCKAPVEQLVKMTLSHNYTGSAFRNHIIDSIRKNKVTKIVDEKHAALVPIYQQADFIVTDEINKYKGVIRRAFKKGELYVHVFDLHLKGHSDAEINQMLGIQSSHTIKHRIAEVLKNVRRVD